MAASSSLVIDILARDKASKVFSNVNVATAALGVAVAKFGIDSVKAYASAEKSQAELAAAFSKFPALADSNLESLQKLNKELSKKTVYDDDATASAQALLAQFGLTGKQIEKITPLVQDYATVTGKDLVSAAQDLGKATLGSTKALKAIGISGYKPTGDKARDLASLQGLLNQKLGGFAEKEGKTAALLEQHLPNVFQMNVANILPGDDVKVELRYTELLLPTDGNYQFVFPTVVGPRYNSPQSSQANATWVAQPYLPQGQKIGRAHV